jgi:hypothetical protein
MKSEDKLDVTVKPMPEFGGKFWVHVKHRNTGFAFIPSFGDLYRIIQAICVCEDFKYPNLPNRRGRDMVQDFLWDSCEPGMSYEELAKKYKLPLR